MPVCTPPRAAPNFTPLRRKKRRVTFNSNSPCLRMVRCGRDLDPRCRFKSADSAVGSCKSTKNVCGMHGFERPIAFSRVRASNHSRIGSRVDILATIHKKDQQPFSKLLIECAAGCCASGGSCEQLCPLQAPTFGPCSEQKLLSCTDGVATLAVLGRGIP